MYNEIRGNLCKELGFLYLKSTCLAKTDYFYRKIINFRRKIKIEEFNDKVIYETLHAYPLY